MDFNFRIRVFLAVMPGMLLDVYDNVGRWHSPDLLHVSLFCFIVKVAGGIPPSTPAYQATRAMR